MKQEPKDSPDPLSKALREWQPSATLPPGFQEAVWRRIDAVTPEIRNTTLAQWAAAWFNQFVARPRMAAVYVGFFLMIGITAGWTQGQRESSRVHGELAQRYLQSLDPYLRPR